MGAWWVIFGVIHLCQQKQKEMSNAITQAQKLISKALDANGFLIAPNSRTNKQQAQELLDNNADELYYAPTFNGFEICTALTIIANPTKTL